MLYLLVAFWATTITPFAQAWHSRSCKCVSRKVFKAPSCHDRRSNQLQGPEDRCWPSFSRWERFNTSLGGRLIADAPVAAACYQGLAYNAKSCEVVSVELTNQSFVSDNPIALSYPTDSCPPKKLTGGACSLGDNPNQSCSSANATKGTSEGTCSIGDQPRFTVNATRIAHVVKAVNFARQRNIRLVIRNTGHDILRRYQYLR